jgi:CUG-BP- and ETR3-like factor
MPRRKKSGRKGSQQVTDKPKPVDDDILTRVTEEAAENLQNHRRKSKREDSVSPKITKKTKNGDSSEDKEDVETDSDHIITNETLALDDGEAYLDLSHVNIQKASLHAEDSSEGGEVESRSKIFVGTLPKDMNDGELRQLFHPYGDIEEAIILKNAMGISKCCGFVRYKREEDAANAIKEMNCKRIRENERPIQVRLAETEPKESWKLFIGSIPNDFDEEKLQEVFEPFGKLVLRHSDGSSRNAGFVRYVNKSDAKRAIASLNEVYYPPHSKIPLVVRFAEPHRLIRQMMSMNMWTPFMSGTPMVPTLINPTTITNTTPMSMAMMRPSKGLGRGYVGNTMGMSHPSVTTYPMDYMAAMGLISSTGNVGYGYGLSPMYPNMMGHMPYTSLATSNVPPKSAAWPEGPEGANIFIYNVPFSCSEQDLYALFAPFGNIMATKIVLDKATQRSKGIGYIAFDNPVSAQFAMQQMNGYTIQGKPLKVVPKRPKPGLEASPSS